MRRVERLSPSTGCKGYTGSQWQTCATSGMISIPSTQQKQTVTDDHMAPCINLGTGAGCTSADVTSTATEMFGSAWTFLTARSLRTNLMMFGETYSNAPTTSCNGDTPTSTQQGVAGYVASTLSLNDGANVVLRPWEWVMASVCKTPANIGAPSGPFAP